jgi:hypothetical protein
MATAIAAAALQRVHQVMETTAEAVAPAMAGLVQAERHMVLQVQGLILVAVVTALQAAMVKREVCQVQVVVAPEGRVQLLGQVVMAR